VTAPERTQRESVDEVQRLVERLLPEAGCRHTALQGLADAIDAAHGVGANRWAVTINRQEIRLNVGSYVAYAITRDGIWLSLETKALEPDLLPQLQQRTDWATTTFKSYPTAATPAIACDQLDDILPLIRNAHGVFIRTAAAQVSQIRTQVREAHVPGVIAYLQLALEREVPEPEYVTASIPAVEREVIEQALRRFDEQYRHQPEWADWEANQTYKYAIVWEHQQYPVKEIVRIATGVEEFGGTRARAYVRQRGFEVIPLRSDAQHVWLFQANPRYYDLAERLVSATANDADEWTVTRYRDEMRPGDPVVFWLAGSQAGIYAIGELTGAPFEHTYAPDEIPEWVTPNSTGPTTVWRVPFRYTDVLPEPLRKPTFQEHAVLQHMMVLRVPNNTNFKVTTEEWEAIQTLLDRVPSTLPLVGQNPEYSLSQCAAETGIDEVELGRWLRAIERKGQAVLYGPPGTGKTFVSQRLARHLIGGGNGFVELVQFHPAYTYEDFIQGIRPQSLADGTLTYPLVPGRFLDFCARAKAITDTCVLIVDEINRANLARVFGELMYLLEYRDHSLPLAGGNVLSIPPNVRIIGTMNTADRSIALVDHALRRRFAFLPLQPNYTVLRRFQAQHGFDASGLIAVLEQVNRDIGDANYAVGISFFMRTQLDQELEDLWRMEIEPYLEEYFFDRREVFERFRWAHIAARVQP
jgi:hypothetical protein